MPEVDLDFPRAWVEFADPADGDQVFRCDLTWLTSRTSASSARAARASTPARRTRLLHARRALLRQGRREAGGVVRRQARPTTWQHRPQKAKVRRGDWIETDEDGERKTRTVDVDGQSACIFHNRTDFAAGAGCALHALALREGQHPLETKPDVCWQLPIRRTYRDRRAAGRDDVLRGHDRGVRPPRLGPGRARPRLVLLGQHRGPRRARAALRDQRAGARRADGPGGVRRAGARTARRTSRPAPRSRCTPPTRADDVADGILDVKRSDPDVPREQGRGENLDMRLDHLSYAAGPDGLAGTAQRIGELLGQTSSTGASIRGSVLAT